MYKHASRDSREPAGRHDQQHRRLGRGRVLSLCASRGRLSKVLNHRFVFTFLAFATIIAKIIHIIARERGLPRRHLALWSFSFVAQDLILLVTIRMAMEWADRLPQNLLVRSGAMASLVGVVAFSTTICVVNITFFVYAHSEVQWRNIAFAKDPSSRGVLMSGFVTLLAVVGLLAAIALVLQNRIYDFARVAVEVIAWPWKRFRRLRDRENGDSRARLQYRQLSRVELAELPDEFDDEKRAQVSPSSGPLERRSSRFSRAVWAAAILADILSFIVRPSTGSLTYMSWTSPLLPFVDFKESASNLQGLQPVYGTGIGRSWDNKTALDHPLPFAWLPRDTALSGFEDWYETDGRHYNAAADPLKISNLDQSLLPELRRNLSDISIKHIVLVLMESTRKDVFPIKKDDLIWNRFAKVHGNNELSEAAAQQLESLTPIANYLTGDYSDGFSHKTRPARGGLNFNDAYTASTYTLKSTVATMCGIWPLIADLNLEYLHHIYQPCLPHVLEAFSALDRRNGTEEPEYAPWTSHFLQSITLAYDHGDVGTAQFGFPPENIIDSRYLQSEAARFGKVELPDINYFGFQETPLLDYFHDIFSSAREKKERVFMTHVTSTTHHPYAMPANEASVPLGDGRLRQLSDYVNSVGYDDRWLGQILKVLDEEEVADETLVVLVGDHGISLPENNKPASYYNPNTGCNRVPLVLSHPKLPAINIDGPVSSMEILPTILDLLRETGSLSEVASAAAGDLLANYEGQSLIRTLRNSAPISESKYAKSAKQLQSVDSPALTGEGVLGNWQFVVMNPGRAMVGVRDKRRKHWRLVAPVLKNVVWLFSDLESDPLDNDASAAFDLPSLLRKIEKKHGIEQARWAEEAAFIARWFVDENNKRWRYGEYAMASGQPAAASA